MISNLAVPVKDSAVRQHNQIRIVKTQLRLQKKKQITLSIGVVYRQRNNFG